MDDPARCWRAGSAAPSIARLLVAGLLCACAALYGEAQPLHRGEFTIPSRVPGNPTVTCRYAVRLTADGATPASADNLVCMFPFPQQERFDQGGMFERFANAGVAVFGVFFANQGHGEVDLDDHAACYYYPESGSGDAIIAAAAKVRETLGLAQRRLLLFGESGGASAAEQFAVAHPDLVDAVAITGGVRYAQAKPGTTRWLIINSRGDDIERANDQLAQALGAAALRITTPPEWWRRGHPAALFGHCPDDHARELIVSYILGVAALRDRAGGELAPCEQWPIAATPADPARTLEHASGDALRFPSAEFQRAWCTVPRSPETLAVRGGECRLARPAPAQAPKALVFDLVDDAEERPSQTRYDLDQLAASGFVAVACPRSSLGDGTEIARAARERCHLADGLPVFVIAWAPDEAAMAAFAAEPVAGRLFFDVWPATRAEALKSLAAHDLGSPVELVATADREDAAVTTAFVAAAAASAAQAKVERETFGMANCSRIHALRMERSLARFEAWRQQAAKGDL